MESIPFPCEFCGQPVPATEDQVGTDVPCASCGRLVTVPRPRMQLKVKGREGARRRPASAGAARDENLAVLTETGAFGEGRAIRLTHNRRVALVKQLVVGICLALSIGGVSYGVWRYLYRQKQEKQRAADTAEQAHARRLHLRTIWREGQGWNHRAKQVSPGWTLSEDACGGLWLAITELYPDRRSARTQFDACLRADALTCGHFSVLYDHIASEAEVEPACQELIGLALGMQGQGADTSHVELFRRVAREKVRLAAAGLLVRPI